MTTPARRRREHEHEHEPERAEPLIARPAAIGRHVLSARAASRLPVSYLIEGNIVIIRSSGAHSTLG